jgi:CBS domain-containing protein
MKAKDIMVSDIPVISMKTSVAEAVRMLKNNFGDESFLNAAPGLIVLNERGALAGILTPLSIITALLEDARGGGAEATPGAALFLDLCDRIKDLPIEDIMEHQAISVTEDALLVDVAELFVKHRFQRVPVVMENRVVGIIYRSRLLFAMTDSLMA